MNTPNKLTVLRVCLVPVFVALLMIEAIPHHYLLALAVFTAASLTDLLDGYLARRDGLVTDFGKFMDPLADKILVTSAMICFIELGFAPAVLIAGIIAREFTVTSLRLIGAGKGAVIAADIWGKWKTVTQMVWIIAVLFFSWLGGLVALPGAVGFFLDLLLWLVTALTVFSGVNYLWGNRALLRDVK
ncbi:MAG: CDP-diacylglycerol--glycerol-3-phosphate 3-phosphatidyltransferase [Oscillospiraceae bacterium]|nr:CDP-diacylglycerol--glycerol-3-phosphate 3-phosphatidyltransferase [Oscillospiraceae bacterium]